MVLPATAARVARSRTRVPFSFGALDARFGGIPTGSCVLLAGEPDAGPDAFVHTSAARTMLARHYPGRYRQETGTDVADDHGMFPDDVTYVTLSRSRDRVLTDIASVLPEEQFTLLAEHLTVADFSDEFLARTPVPRSLLDRPSTAAGAPGSRAEEPAAHTRLLDDISDRLADVAGDSLVVINSLTDIQRALEFGLSRSDLLAFLIGLRRAATGWDGLVFVLYHRRAERVRDDEDVSAAFDGNVYFHYETGRSGDRRTMRVGDFRGQVSNARQVTYETEVTDEGFRVRTGRSM